MTREKLPTCKLGKEIWTTFKKLEELLEQIPSKYWNENEIPFSGDCITVSELIAYQIGWGQMLISWYRSGLKNETIEMPGEGFSSWKYKEIAQYFFKKHSQKSPDQLRALFRAVILEIITFIDHEEQMNRLYKVGIWAWCTLPSGKKWPLSKWATVNTVSPYKRALKLLGQFKKNQPA